MQQFGVRGPLHDTQLVDSDSETVLRAEVMEPGDKLSVVAEERRIKNGSILSLPAACGKGKA